jgi:hypothetical protein
VITKLAESPILIELYAARRFIPVYTLAVKYSNDITIKIRTVILLQLMLIYQGTLLRDLRCGAEQRSVTPLAG